MTWEDTKRRATAGNFARLGVSAVHVRGAARSVCRVILGRDSEMGLDRLESQRAEPMRTVSVQTVEIASVARGDVFEADDLTLTVDAVTENTSRVIKALVL